VSQLSATVLFRPSFPTPARSARTSARLCVRRRSTQSGPSSVNGRCGVCVAPSSAEDRRTVSVGVGVILEGPKEAFVVRSSTQSGTALRRQPPSLRICTAAAALQCADSASAFLSAQPRFIADFASAETAVDVEADDGEVNFERFFAVCVLRINAAAAPSRRVRSSAAASTPSTSATPPSVEFARGSESLHAAAAMTNFAPKAVFYLWTALLPPKRLWAMPRTSFADGRSADARYVSAGGGASTAQTPLLRSAKRRPRPSSNSKSVKASPKQRQRHHPPRRPFAHCGQRLPLSAARSVDLRHSAVDHQTRRSALGGHCLKEIFQLSHVSRRLHQLSLWLLRIGRPTAVRLRR
jgi:hypothetical protein